MKSVIKYKTSNKTFFKKAGDKDVLYSISAVVPKDIRIYI